MNHGINVMYYFELLNLVVRSNARDAQPRWHPPVVSGGLDLRSIHGDKIVSLRSEGLNRKILRVHSSRILLSPVNPLGYVYTALKKKVRTEKTCRTKYRGFTETSAGHFFSCIYIISRESQQKDVEEYFAISHTENQIIF